MDLMIFYEDNEILVCKKPARIPTQSSRLGTPDMVSILKNHIRASLPKGQASYLSVIHRLDQPVEGLLVFAKTRNAARQLNAQLNSTQFEKKYLALLCGIPPMAEADLEDYLIKDGRDNTSRVCSSQTPGAKKARLHYRTLYSYKDMAAAEIVLGTGRHHQIRVQMANLGCPICGDLKYGKDQVIKTAAKEELQLFAFSLSFFHPSTKKALHFSYIPAFPPEFHINEILSKDLHPMA